MTTRVLLVSNKLGNGGAERVLTHVANGLHRSGVQVGLFLFRQGGEYEALLHPDIPIYYCQQFEPRPLYQWYAGWRLSQIAGEYDIVYAAGGGSDTVVVHRGQFFARPGKTARAYLARVANTISHACASRPHKIRRFVKFTPHFTGLIVPSHGVKDDVKELLQQRTPPIYVIYNPVDIALVQEKSRVPLDDDVHAPYFLNIGRLSPHKDQATLIRAFAQFHQETGSAHHLIILGRGGEEARLRQVSQECGVEALVHLRGFAANPWQFMAHATAVVSSSVVEGMSNVILEAMVCRTPVIGTDCPSGTADLLQHDRHGYLAPMRDPSAIASAMRRVVEHPDEASQRAECAYAFVQQQQVDQVVQRYIATFEKVLQQLSAPSRT